MKEEDQILRKVGTENPFTVPDGYFEHLTSDVMGHLPERNETEILQPVRITMWTRLKPYIYLAAMFVGAALIIRIASTPTVTPTTMNDSIAEITELIGGMEDESIISDEYLDYTINQAMLEDYSLYVYLSDAGSDY
ncbi:MAG: hypothetical protein LBM61_06280 [Prevotellaceae bacterium]|jgi:hypothetical protein|nr:hypothetical protein [Prevotellaceae bacterium]